MITCLIATKPPPLIFLGKFSLMYLAYWIPGMIHLCEKILLYELLRLRWEFLRLRPVVAIIGKRYSDLCRLGFVCLDDNLSHVAHFAFE